MIYSSIVESVATSINIRLSKMFRDKIEYSNILLQQSSIIEIRNMTHNNLLITGFIYK